MKFNKMQLSEIDISILRFVHHNRITAVDGFLYYISFATTFVSVSIILVILIVAIKNRSAELFNKCFRLVAVLISSAIVSLSLKYLIARERPFVKYPDIQKLSEVGNSSFPSGHTIEAFAMALAIAILFPRWKYVIVIFLWALLVAYSRMALGVHYPLDVLSGIIIGLTTSYLIIKTFKLSFWKKRLN